jgi:hypothetical protein
MLEGLLPIASVGVAEDVTLIIPLGLVLVTLGWVGWTIHRRERAN